MRLFTPLHIVSHRILRGDGPIILSSAIPDFKASLVRQPSTWTPTRYKKRQDWVWRKEMGVGR